MPDPVGGRRHRHLGRRLAGPGVVEQAEVDGGGVLGEDGEVDPFAVPRGAEWVGAPRPDPHGQSPSPVAGPHRRRPPFVHRRPRRPCTPTVRAGITGRPGPGPSPPPRVGVPGRGPAPTTGAAGDGPRGRTTVPGRSAKLDTTTARWASSRRYRTSTPSTAHAVGPGQVGAGERGVARAEPDQARRGAGPTPRGRPSPGDRRSSTARSPGGVLRRVEGVAGHAQRRPSRRPARPGRPAQFGIAVVDEVRERCHFAVLLAHEQQGDVRGTAAPRPPPAAAASVDSSVVSRSPAGRLPIWSWFWAKTTSRSGLIPVDGAPWRRRRNDEYSPWKQNPSAMVRASWSRAPKSS